MAGRRHRLKTTSAWPRRVVCNSQWTGEISSGFAAQGKPGAVPTSNSHHHRHHRFDPFDAGTLADSWRQQPMTPAYCTELGLQDLENALHSADRDEAPRNRDRMTERYFEYTSTPTREQLVELNRSLHR
ncbi:hypothetical protein SVIOM74S_02116 [Streptomyces violarus]